MPRPRKRWRHSEGRRGETVAIYEARLGGDLRWDYQDGDGERRRPWVEPAMRVRREPGEPVDPVLERAAVEECRRLYHELRGRQIRHRLDAHDLTMGEAFALFHDPRDGGLPKSRSARTHHRGSRAYWIERMGEDTRWNDVRPAHVESALREIIASGRVPTARKRYANLHTVQEWLRRKMRLRGLEDPTLGVDIRELTAGYEPRRPRYTPEEAERIVAAAPVLGWRLHLFTVLMADSGARGGQVRRSMRSGLDAPIEPGPPAGLLPHGWQMMPAMKRQKPMLAPLTSRARAVIDDALAGPLAEWEASYRAGELADFPLIPGGRTDRGELIQEPISDTALRQVWPKLEAAAGVPTRPRRVFHALRRRWADDMREAIGADDATHAGGWSSRETYEKTYLSPRQWGALDAARRAREGGRDDAE